MLYRFAEFELDEQQRELRLRGREIVLQPRVFDLLVYLVRNREPSSARKSCLMRSGRE
jgi:DNA-binding winged helix-turn-helix (wHTH) protein